LNDEKGIKVYSESGKRKRGQWGKGKGVKEKEKGSMDINT
jgi:hypothetical protein